MGRKPLGKEKYLIKLRPEVANALTTAADDLKTNRSELIERIARKFLRRHGYLKGK
jgi:metal-responsive CopG/Arc/MetJ family transcriptional regulator